jgi:hypothetical protein
MSQSNPYDTNISIEELIKLAQADTTNDRISDVGEFILECQLVPTEKALVESMIVYWTYIKWCKGKGIVPLGRNSFHKEFKTRFKDVQRPNGKRYYIESAALTISKDEWWRMRKALRNERKIKEV